MSKFGTLWPPALLAVAATVSGCAPALAQQPPSDPERFHIYLLAGQSNMAGRGVVEPQDSVIHPRVWMLDRDLNWVPAVDPMHFDKPVAGVGPGRSFGIAMAEGDPTVHIGLVPTAVGGSAITSWVPGGIHRETGAYPWDEAIVRVRSAMAGGKLKGILWHQGESDSGNAASTQYAGNLSTLIARFRTELDAPTLPFVIGQLGRFAGSPWGQGQMRVDAAHQAAASEVPNVTYVSADGLADNGDNLHFSNAAARELGLRYAEGYRSLLTRTTSPTAVEGP
jgi:hypothetical protein